MADQLEATKDLIRITTNEYQSQEHMFLKESVDGYSADEDCTLIVYMKSGVRIEITCQDPSGLAAALVSELGWT